MGCTVKLIIDIHFKRVKVTPSLSHCDTVLRRHTPNADQIFKLVATLLQVAIVLANRFIAIIQTIQMFLYLPDGDRSLTDDAKHIVQHIERDAYRFASNRGCSFCLCRRLVTIAFTPLNKVRGQFYIFCLRTSPALGDRAFWIEIVEANISLVDAISPIENILQNSLRILWCWRYSLHIFKHGFDGIGRLLHGVRQRLWGSYFLFGNVFKDVFNMMRQRCNTASSHQVSGTFQGVRNTLGCFDITLDILAAGYGFHQMRQLFSMPWRFSKKCLG